MPNTSGGECGLHQLVISARYILANAALPCAYSPVMTALSVLLEQILNREPSGVACCQLHLKVSGSMAGRLNDADTVWGYTNSTPAEVTHAGRKTDILHVLAVCNC